MSPKFPDELPAAEYAQLKRHLTGALDLLDVDWTDADVDVLLDQLDSYVVHVTT